MKKKLSMVLLILALCGSVFAEEVFLLRLSQNDQLMVQINSEFEPATYKCKKGAMLNQNVVGPVEEGSVFLLVDDVPAKEKNFGLRAMLFEHEMPTLQSTRRFTVIPNERRISLIYDSIDLYHSKNEKVMSGSVELYETSEDSLNEYKKSGVFKKGIQGLIKAALKEYAGTEWEDALNAELEEWK